MQCANGFSVTRPSLNRSFTIRHAVSLTLRRHSRTQSQLATSVKRHSVPRTCIEVLGLARARRRRTFDVLNWGEPDRAPDLSYCCAKSSLYIIGASLSEPHLDELAGAFLWYIYIPYSSKFSWHTNFVKRSKLAKVLIFVVKMS